jgi:cyclopropane fatty-acyl-phospholipid synthase-like methyltransferase
MKRSLHEIYNGFAKTYEANRGFFDISEILDAFYSRLALEQGHLLDLGCGAGEPVARFFVDRRWSVTGVDFSERMLELATHYVPEMKILHADITKVNFPASQFNAITASYSLFHVPASEHTALFEKIYCWLHPDGKFLFTYATQEYTGSQEFDGYKKFMDQELFYSHKSPDALYTDLEKVGFNIDATEYRNIGNETFLWVTACK